MELLAWAAKAVEEAQYLGSEQSEAYIMRADGLDIEVRDGEVENLDLTETLGLGLKTIKNGHLGFAYTSLLEDGSLRSLAASALANGELTSPDECYALPEKQEAADGLELADPEIINLPVEEKIALACQAEKAAKDFDKRITNVRAASYGDADCTVGIVNSRGFSAEYRSVYCGASISLIAEDNEVQTGSSYQLTRKYHDLEAARIGREAAGRAVEKLGAGRMDSCEAPVILDPRVGVSFLRLILPSLTGEAVQKGKSLFQNKDKAASELVTLVDDGLLAGGLGTAPFDDEGVRQSRKVLVNCGSLEQLLHNTYSAKKAGTVSTGNASRGSYKGLPGISAANFFLNPGKISAEEIMGSVKRGFYVTEVMGLHTANPISGEFSLGACGFLIENGKKARPVKGVAIAGNLQDLLNNIDLVGSDLCFYGSVGAPTVRIKKMTIAG